MKALFALFFFLSCLCCHAETANQIPPPPENLPIKVYTGFRLIRLISIDEREETFKANIYLTFKWEDPRLTFTPQNGEIAKVYLEDAVSDKFKEIWWPQLEYKNTDRPTFNNQTLLIFPDGKVEYYVGLTAKFRFLANFKRFPFDTQTLPVFVDSFIWSDNYVVFVPDSKAISKPEEVAESTAQIITNISESSFTVAEPELIPLNGSGNYSMYSASILIKRNFYYFISQIMVPIFILLMICFPVFLDYEAPFIHKLLVNVSCFLALVAIKFAVAVDLPHISYMTILDKFFLVGYCFVGTAVLVNFIHLKLETKRPIYVQRMNRYAPWVLLVLFVISVASIMLFS